LPLDIIGCRKHLCVRRKLIARRQESHHRSAEIQGIDRRAIGACCATGGQAGSCLLQLCLRLIQAAKGDCGRSHVSTYRPEFEFFEWEFLLIGGPWLTSAAR
jgi:hypothetical protein